MACRSTPRTSRSSFGRTPVRLHCSRCLCQPADSSLRRPVHAGPSQPERPSPSADPPVHRGPAAPYRGWSFPSAELGQFLDELIERRRGSCRSRGRDGQARAKDVALRQSHLAYTRHSTNCELFLVLSASATSLTLLCPRASRPNGSLTASRASPPPETSRPSLLH